MPKETKTNPSPFTHVICMSSGPSLQWQRSTRRVGLIVTHHPSPFFLPSKSTPHHTTTQHITTQHNTTQDCGAEIRQTTRQETKAKNKTETKTTQDKAAQDKTTQDKNTSIPQFILGKRIVLGKTKLPSASTVSFVFVSLYCVVYKCVP
jgi:hypothetical protein